MGTTHHLHYPAPLTMQQSETWHPLMRRVDPMIRSNWDWGRPGLFRVPHFQFECTLQRQDAFFGLGLPVFFRSRCALLVGSA